MCLNKLTYEYLDKSPLTPVAELIVLIEIRLKVSLLMEGVEIRGMLSQ